MKPSSDITPWLQAAGRSPLLRADEEVHLGTLVRRHQDWPGGPDAAPANVRRSGLRARERMIQANLRLVVAVAKRFSGRCRPGGPEMQDLLQEGSIGLARGVEKFDPARGYKASTFLFWWIRQGVARAASCNNGPIRLPSGQTQLPWDMDKARQALRLELGREPSAGEVAAALGTTAAALEDRLELIRRARCSSLDAGIGSEEDGSLADVVADPAGADPLAALEQQLALEALEQAMADLPELERQALDLELQGVRATDAAAVAGCTVQTLRKRREQAQRRLRVRLELGSSTSLAHGPAAAPAQPPAAQAEPASSTLAPQAPAAPALAEPAPPGGELLAEPVQLELCMESSEPGPPAVGRPTADPAPPEAGSALAEALSMRARMERAWRSNCRGRRQLVAA